MSAVRKPARPWEVWDDLTCHRFTTLALAERFARQIVVASKRPLKIRHGEHGERGHLVAHVREDALGRVWTDVVDCSAL